MALTALATDNVITEVEEFSALQTAMANGGNIKLTADITSPASNGLLTVPSGKTVVLDLNNCTITAASGRYYVISVEEGGSLTINATGGGGITNSNTQGYAIVNYGKLTVNGGTFVGDYALYNGSYRSDAASAALNGGSLQLGTVQEGFAYDDTICYDNNEPTDTYGSKVYVNIKAGNIEGDIELHDVPADNISITGGTFSDENVVQYLPNGYTLESYLNDAGETVFGVKSTNNPQSADNSNIALLFVVFTVSCAACAVMPLMGKRNTKR